MNTTKIPLVLVFILLLIFFQLQAQTDTVVQKVIVGIKITPPFIIEDAQGDLSGVSIDLWENIANKLGLVFEYKEYDLQGVLNAIETEKVDICINPLTVTSSRLKNFDFTQPYYISNLAIAAHIKTENELWVTIKQLFSFAFLKAILLLFGVIWTFGFLLWLVEHRQNDQFRSGIKGIGDGIWWSAVTMTTVGYGDKAPVTFWGRVVGTIWMFTAIITISGFTAGIATTLTVKGLDALHIENLDDLRKAKVGTLLDSSSDEFLSQRGIGFTTYKTVEEGLTAIGKGQLQAFVYDEPVLAYSIEHHKYKNDLILLPQDFNTEYYSFGLPDQHPLLDTINPVLIEEIEGREWHDILSRYHLKEN